VNRRALLGTALSLVVAGCGWAQEGGQEPGAPPDQESSGDGSGDGSSEGGSADDGDGGGDNDDSGTPEETLATSEGGDEPIEKPAEQLLLRLADLGSEGWEETNAQLTGTCNTFGRDTEKDSFELHACASVYDDEPTAVEEYEGALDRSTKLMTETLDTAPEIGNEASVIRESEADGNFGEVTIRLLFRDTNATGQIDLISDSGLPTEGEDQGAVYTVEDLGELGARMHDRWRD